MIEFGVKDIIKATKGKAYNVKDDTSFSDIVIDNRVVKKNNLFVAIKGERFDGHDFVEDAVKRGASGCVVEKPFKDIPCIVVKNTKDALLDMAQFNRNRYEGVLVGITGSVGKTTTKDMVATVLSADKKVLKTQGNLNNKIGMSKTLFGLGSSFDAAVVEMGMSNLGEISELSKVAKPTIGIITNIGYSHLENLKTRENILKAKLEILDGMESKARLIVGADNDMLKGIKIVGTELIKCGIENKNADFRACNIIYERDHTLFDIKHGGKTTKIRLNALGKHNVYNALFSFAVGVLSKMETSKIVEALLHYKAQGFRQNIVKRDGIKYIVDCYNAAPDSMNAALNILKDMEVEGKKVAVLGDMLELGESAKKYHEQVGEMVSKSGVDVLFCVGDLSRYILKGGKRVKLAKHFNDTDSLKKELNNIIKKGDVVLLKASRGLKLETVVETIIK